MAELYIADRRRVVARALADADYLGYLQRAPVAAIADETGKMLDDAMEVSIVVEADDGHFKGVLPRPSALAEGLPDPLEYRDVWDNLLLATVALDEEARAELLADPARYVDEVARGFPGNSLDILVETPQRTFLVVHHRGDEEELDDCALDLVSAGGNPNCQLATSGVSRT